MAIVQFSYLFDEQGFFNIISPIVSELEIGNYIPLLNLAKKTLQIDPNLWDYLNDLNLGYTFDEEEEGELDAGSLLMKVIVKYLQPISTTHGAWRMLRPVLPIVGWSSIDANLLLFGRSLCDLLAPQQQLNPRLYYTRKAYETLNRPWCEGYGGWLDFNTTALLCNKLATYKTHVLQVARTPPEAIRAEYEYVQDYSDEWYLETLISAYEYTQNVFNTVVKAKTALILAIA